MADIFETDKLPAASIDGDEIPASDVECSWQNTLVAREFMDVDGEGHDNTKRKSLKFAVTAYFMEAHKAGQFTTVWPRVFAKLIKGDLLEFRHPSIGIISCRCEDGSFAITTKMKTGVAVRINFVESLREADQPTQLEVTSSAEKAAAAADEAMQEIGLDYPDGSINTSFGQMLNDIKNIGANISFEVTNEIYKVVDTVDQVYETVQAVANTEVNLPSNLRPTASHPFRPALEINLNLFRVALVELAKKAKQGSAPVKKFITTEPTSLAGLSFSLPADVGKLIALNPALLLSPLIPKGVTVYYPKAA